MDKTKLTDLVHHEAILPPPGKPSQSGTCRICNTETTHGYSTDEVFSNAFTSSSILSGGDCICWLCKYLANAKHYRRYHWIATESQGIQVTKDRAKLLDTILEPPEEPWMIQIVSDYLNTLNGWINAIDLNQSNQRYRILVDRDIIHLEKSETRKLTDYAEDLRDRGVAKKVMRNGPSAGDMEYYELEYSDIELINNRRNREDWQLIVKLIE